MISKYTYKKLTWIDLESPTREEVVRLVEEYDLSALVGEELLTETVRSKVDVHDNLIYLILHFPSLKQRNGRRPEQEIDFVIGKNFLITTHYEAIDPIHEFSKIFEVNSILDKTKMGDHAGFLFFYIIKELYRFSMVELENFNSLLEKIEEGIFEGNEGKMVEEISRTKRQLIDFKQAIRFHKEVLRSFEGAGKTFFGEDFGYYLSAISGEYNKVENVLDGHMDILNDLRETNDSLLSSKTGETIKTLTIMTFIMLPLTLITGIFGMNADIVFIKDIPDFMVVIVVMSLIALTMFFFFKSRKWL